MKNILVWCGIIFILLFFVFEVLFYLGIVLLIVGLVKWNTNEKNEKKK